MKKIKKVITMILALALVTGMFTCLLGSQEAYAASKALKNARLKAVNSLEKTYNSLADKKAYTEANYKKLISVKEKGIKKINAAKSKKSVSKVLKTYTSNLKKVKYMQPKDPIVSRDRTLCMGDNGVVIWKDLEGIVKYRVEYIKLVEGCPIGDHVEETTETYAKLKIGRAVIVYPILADGYELPMYTSEYYKLDEWYRSDEYKIETQMDEPKADESAFMTWNAFEKIDTKSVKKNKDGSVYFETKGPDGEKISFWGEDIDVKKDGIILHKKGRIMMTDGFGKIYDMQPIVKSCDPEDTLSVFAGFNIDYDMHPKTIDRMIFSSGGVVYAFQFERSGMDLSMFEANFVGIGIASPEYDAKKEKGNKANIEVSNIIIKYIPSNECTRFREMIISPFMYPPYLSGDYYDESKEIYDPYNGAGYFHLLAFPDLDNDNNEITVNLSDFDRMWPNAVSASYGDYYRIGNLKDSKGKEYERKGGKVVEGTTLTVYLGDVEFDVPLNVLEVYEGAKTMHDLIPYANPKATGEKNVLVIPIVWQDEKNQANENNLDILRNRLGKAAKLGEKIKDYSEKEENGFSLSKYFDIASYGKLQLQSYYTDWYTAPYNFAEMKDRGISRQFIDEVLDWLYKNYPNTDFSIFDPDKNGYFDHIIFVNFGDMSSSDGFTMASFGAACDYRCTYGKEYAWTADRPCVNRVLNINSEFLGGNSYNTLIHEFGHGFGLIDYYDVTYSGINAVGGYDMQSDSYGDWNAYSKYAVGWIEPEVIKGLKKGESKDIEIGAFADTGDAIVIPIAGDELNPPFSEYMMVDLYTSTGVNKYDSIKYGINDFEGVRIYHVDAKMERRDFQNSDYPNIEPTPIGTIHFANDYKSDGRFNIELIQAGTKNTFTDKGKLRNKVSREDFFQAGDKFTMEKYSEFFKDGLMDFGDEFGYEIEVISITGTGSNAKAKIRITRK